MLQNVSYCGEVLLLPSCEIREQPGNLGVEIFIVLGVVH